MKYGEDSNSHKVIGLAASLIVAVIVGAAAYKNSGTFATTQFWFITFATLVFVFLLEQYAVITLLTPHTPTAIPIATDISIADNMAAATHNLCAISSNWLGFWLTESYLYYLHLNTAKSLQSLTKQAGSYIEQLSNDSTLCDDFYNRGFQLARNIANRTPQSQFFSLRLLVYSAAEYDLRAGEVTNLISAQALGGVHCIPLVSDELKARMSEQEWNVLTYVAKDICHQTFRLKVEPRPRVVKLKDAVTGKARVAQLVPDILIINNDDVIPKDVTCSSSLAWWHDEQRHGSVPSAHRHELQNAKEAFRILCRHAQDCKWQRYTSRTIKLVPLVHNSAAIPTPTS